MKTREGVMSAEGLSRLIGTSLQVKKLLQSHPEGLPAYLLGSGKTTLYRKLREYSRDSATPIDVCTREVSFVEHFLICKNPKCRFIVNLRESGQEVHRSELIVHQCPECDHE
jgi:hypothetical protein